ncbi:RxLR effector protein [Phytophthora megakarya]|uniref:RxLR effector protein n=1 Tax=Phytophthora megakarya TaxID=4795 RepID=A0A225UXN4_9STRA|nr:RxLR effector protein [Phytophthora megakarya]
MNLRYVLLVVTATIIANISIASADNAKFVKLNSVPSAQNEQHEFVRSLLEDDEDNAVTKPGSPRFMEQKLQKALTNPKKTAKLYEYWAQKGYTAKQISSEMGQTENRELSHTFTKLSKGYATYLKNRK